MVQVSVLLQFYSISVTVALNLYACRRAGAIKALWKRPQPENTSS